jgi:hypothetical protein
MKKNWWSASLPEFINFEDVQNKRNDSPQFVLINILSENEQSCLIANTLSIDEEIKTMNEWVQQNKMFEHSIILYGKNVDDYIALDKKKQKLQSLGFYNVYIYLGGLFEWLLLQDIYGNELFPTTSETLDILIYSASKKLNNLKN